ncbi:hypothetical protein K5M36_17015 [Chromobacterium vaccinii]|nr:hypothetical protein [Chromobacterium vaccinii]
MQTLTQLANYQRAASVLYQILGVYDAPAKVLDLASAMMRGEPLPFDPQELLPFMPASATDQSGEAANAEDQAVYDSIAANYRQQPEPVVPEGWQLVPKLLTPQMRRAAGEYDRNTFDPTWAGAWEALLAAAPQPAQRLPSRFWLEDCRSLPEPEIRIHDRGDHNNWFSVDPGDGHVYEFICAMVNLQNGGE